MSEETILKAAREKQLVTYKEAPIRLSAEVSRETSQARGIGTYNEDYFTQQSYHLESKDRQRASQTRSN